MNILNLTRRLLPMFALIANGALAQPAEPRLRPPSTPLIACDPYFSIWSPGDKLTDVNTTHWTGRAHRLFSTVTIDGKTYRVMGAARQGEPALAQKSLTVLPTRTIYTFEEAGIALTLTFMTPMLPGEIDLISRPVTYLTYEFRATDGNPHEVGFSFDASAELTVDFPRQPVAWSTEAIGPLTALKMGSQEQNILGKKGDDLRIDWGYLYVAARTADLAAATIGGADSQPAPAEQVTAALVFKVGKVSKKPVARWLLLAYDDLYSIQYMKENLRPYWRRNGWEAADLLKASAKDYRVLAKRCAAFDEELMADLAKAGGAKYAQICALAYRQCFAGGKFVADKNGQPLQFPKENHSNGCISTSDVLYPMSPQFLLFGPTVTKACLVPFMNYAASERWKFPFAPHDLGTYPKANGQVYGGGELTEDNQMPVEESGNLLILFAALAKMEGNAKFAALYWPQLERWAEYLKAKGFDPENQLCTDDFAGHLAHNVNLSAKAICGLGAFAKLCEISGDKTKSDEYFKLARQFAAKWVKEADDGDHFRLAFDKPGTWSQKYNLVWDRVLGLNLFPAKVLQKEMAYYRKVQNPYGLPLDNRKEYTKLDWILWTATLTQNRADFEALAEPVYRFINETPDLSPLTDWYQTKTARKCGMTARPVIGGVFAQMLYDPAMWQKWAKRGANTLGPWAPIPIGGVAKEVVPTAQTAPVKWRYTLEQPAGDWTRPGFDDSAWKEGVGGFGTKGTPGAIIGTEWKTKQIWLRREFTLPDRTLKNPRLLLIYDEDPEVYLNGVLAAKLTGWTTSYDEADIAPTALATLKPGNNVMAVRAGQTYGGQCIDVGIAEESAAPGPGASTRPTTDGKLAGLRKLFDFPVRDTSICVGPDRACYLTGTTGHPTWWKQNDGLRIWKSADLTNWIPLGLVWSFDKDATWQKVVKDGNRALWAPEIHYLKGTFWLT